MTACAVTGASGHLGRLVVEELLRRGGYQFSATDLADDQLRPLRDPALPDS